MVQIRNVTLNDVQELLDIYSYYVLNTTITFEYETPSMNEFTQRIQKITQKYPYLVATLDDEIIGYAYATSYKERAAYDWSVETTVYVKNDKHGLGIGKELYLHLEQALKEKNIVNMLACITYPNPKSIDFHTKFGFEKVGHFPKVGYKFNEWRDIVWMQKVIK
ncbi:MAG: GNAT family N-acetyltransferase [Erysipelotrichaceae bacterium]